MRQYFPPAQDAAILVENSTRITFERVSVSDSGSHGWSLLSNVSSIAIVNSSATDLGGDGISLPLGTAASTSTCVWSISRVFWDYFGLYLSSHLRRCVLPRDAMHDSPMNDLSHAHGYRLVLLTPLLTSVLVVVSKKKNDFPTSNFACPSA